MTRVGRVIVVVRGGQPRGAVETVALHQARGLLDQYWVDVVSNGDTSEFDQRLVGEPVRSPELRWLRRFGHAPRTLLFALLAFRWVYRAHRTQSVTAVIFHGHVEAAIYGLFSRFLTNAPRYVLVNHGDISTRPRGTYSWGLTKLFALCAPLAHAHAARVVAISPFMRDLALKRGVPASRVVLIPNGVDPAELGVTIGVDGLDEGEIHDTLRLLYVGRLAREKGVDVLIEAACLLKSRGQRFVLRVVGDGRELDALKRQCCDRGILEDVEFLGAQERSALGALYRWAHITVVPSRDDPLPTVVMESLVCGTPVVGTNVGGIPYMLGLGPFGRVVDSADASDLFEGITDTACSSSPSMRQLASRARECFSWSRSAGKLAQVLDDLERSA